MRLKDLLKNIYSEPIDKKYQDAEICAVDCDSRKVKAGSLFVAVQGTKTDGIRFVEQAIQKGAVCVVKPRTQPLNLSVPNGMCILDVDDPKAFLKAATLRFYNNPSKDVRCIGITGTNGKTTTTYLIESILRVANQKCGIIGTIDCRFADKVIKIDNTTPNLIDLCDYLSQMRVHGFNYCAMEVSSHALDQGRADGLDFAVGIFTNLTQDHLDYHKDMENYFLAKAKLFSGLASGSAAVLNFDDPFGQRLAKMTKARVLSYAIKAKADVMAADIKLGVDGTTFNLMIKNKPCVIKTKLIGRHNVYNILASVAACHALGIDAKFIQQGVQEMTRVPGRLEIVDCGQKFSVFVDYAHTDDALKNVLENLRAVKKAKIILVFGCGGDRDKTKRPKMGKVASALADFSIITNDNSRSEDPQTIADTVASGFTTKDYSIILDRRAAIKKALEMAHDGDVVLLAGKGHENYQIIKDKTFPFDDREVAKEILSC